VDRYLASLRAPSPTYEDPYAPWGGARPALQYGLPPEQPRPDTTGWTTPLADYGMGHVPAGMPPMGAPAHAPWPATIPGGPLPSTPGGTILPGGGGGDVRRGAAAFGITDPRAAQRFDAWVDAAHGMGLDYGRAEATAAGGIRWAEENEPADQRGWARSGANLSSYAPNTLNPAQAVSFYGRGGAPNQYQLSGRADVGGNARNLTSIAPPGQAIPDATAYVTDPYQRAADHVTQALGGGTTGGTAMPDQRDPTYHATPNNMGATGVPATGAGGGGMDEEALSYLWADPNRMRSYIMQRGGLSGQHNSYADYFYNAVAPLLIASLRMKGTAGDANLGSLDTDLGGLMSSARTPGSNFFGGIAGQARSTLHNQGFLDALGGINAEDAAQRLNSIIGLTQVGNLDNVYAQALAQKAQDATQQLPVWLAGQHGQGNYIDYIRNQPWLKGLIG
jgi:hypothetical protein